MFYLTRFCRVCIRTSGPLFDLEAADADAVKLSDKLRYVCPQMVIVDGVYGRLMCADCLRKLRVTYLFHKQCAKADEVLERYVREITSTSEEKFVNSELRVTIVPIQRRAGGGDELDDTEAASAGGPGVDGHPGFQSQQHQEKSCSSKPTRMRRRLKQEASFRISEAYKERIRRLRRVCPRITKQQRCLLLKSLLTKTDRNSNSPLTVRKSRKYTIYHSRQKNQPSSSKLAKLLKVRKKTDIKPKGGLRDLLGFIKCYDFGFHVDESEIREQCDGGSVLDQLETFSRTFFYHNFDAYHETILSLANDSESSDDDDMFAPFDAAEDRRLWPECADNYAATVVVKQEVTDYDNDGDDDGRLKSDVQLEAPQVDVKIEPEARVGSEHDDDIDDLLPSALVQACYEDQESAQLRTKTNHGFQHLVQKISKIKSNLTSAELADPAAIVSHLNRISVIPEASTSATKAGLTSLDLLTRLTNSTRLAKDAPKKSGPVPTRCYLKCRTRGNPFINPQLMQQFQTRTFKCDTCNRSFKSPAYLHSHCTKMGH